MKNKLTAQAFIAQAATLFIAITALHTNAYAQQKSTQDAINEYRQSLQDGNPADLNAARGEGLYKAKRGPNNLSLESCDLGVGVGKVKGAVAVLPKYFADAGKVMDVESRLVHCMVTLQGAKREDFKASTAFSGEGAKATLIEDLVAYVYDESRDITINVPQGHTQEKASYARGQQEIGRAHV